jgi:hypothetical protein
MSLYVASLRQSVVIALWQQMWSISADGAIYKENALHNALQMNRKYQLQSPIYMPQKVQN